MGLKSHLNIVVRKIHILRLALERYQLMLFHSRFTRFNLFIDSSDCFSVG